MNSKFSWGKSPDHPHRKKKEPFESKKDELQFIQEESLFEWGASTTNPYYHRRYSPAKNESDRELKRDLIEYVDACRTLGWTDLAQRVVGTVFSNDVEPETFVADAVCWKCGEVFQNQKGKRVHYTKKHTSDPLNLIDRLIER